MTHDLGKKIAAKAAAAYVKQDMIIGVGTGSTVYYFIEQLINLHELGLPFEVICSSEESSRLAHLGKLKFAKQDQIDRIDLTVDGADQIDSKKRMIKGGGGALLREKILAYSSNETLIIVDNSKYVEQLCNQKVPVEILPFGYELTLRRLHDAGFKGKMRLRNETLFITDNQHYICDIIFENTINDPEKLDTILRSIPGVLETGFFFNLAKKIFIGYENGKLDMRS